MTTEKNSDELIEIELDLEMLSNSLSKNANSLRYPNDKGDYDDCLERLKRIKILIKKYEISLMKIKRADLKDDN